MKGNISKLFTLFAVLALAVSGVLAGFGGVQAAEQSVYVRVPAEAMAQVGQMGLSPRLALDYGSFTWLELSQKDYTRLAGSGVAHEVAPSAGKVSVMGYQFDPLAEGEPSLADGMRAEGGGEGLRLVQFVGPVKDEWLNGLGAAGLAVLQYYPENAFLVWGSAAEGAAVEGLSYVRWQGAFHPGYKVSSGLQEAQGVVENVAVTFYNDGDVAGTLARLTGLGDVYVQHAAAQPDKVFYTALYKMDASAFTAAAQIPTVWAIEYSAPRPGFDDEISTQIVSGNYTGSPGTPYPGYFTWLTAKGVDGSGITWADVDTGLNSAHPDIAGRTPVFVSYPGAGSANSDPDGHGSHTAGAIFGDPRVANGGTGITDPSGFYWGAGTAPRAGMVIQNALMGSSWPPAGGWQLLSKDSVVNGASGSSNSWFTGASGAQGYSSAARTHDLMVRDANFDTAAVAEPIIMVFSAGNAGPSPSTMTEPKEAKNLITVAAAYNFRTGAINDLASFSSRGPALDGRLLPNVAAPGVQTASWNGSGATCGSPVSGAGATYYNYCQGTSMAAPLVAGGSALIADWWEQENGVIPSPAMVKALLINGATDMVGGANIGGNIPNNNQGWGRMNLDNVIRNGLYNVYHDQDEIFTASGQSTTFTYGVGDPTKPVKVSLVWVDAPGAIAASPALVNNLNLTVVNGANTYKGNVFSGGWSVTGGTADALNNIENVYIQSASGSVQITIDALNIAGDGVPYNGDTTDQDYALVCYNCVMGADFFMAVDPEFLSVCAPDTAVYTATIGTMLGFNTPIDMSAVGAPAGTSVGFDPNPLTPPGVVEMTISDTLSGTFGLYDIAVVGTAITTVHTSTVQLELFTALPAGPGLISPAPEAIGVAVDTSFTWNTMEQAKSYDVEIATDSGFTNVIASGSGLATPDFTPALPLASNTVFYWRARGSNTCGGGEWSAVNRFITAADAGVCTLGRVSSTLFSEGFETTPSGWVHGGDGDSWALNSTRVHSGSYSFNAQGKTTVSDQWLYTPAITLPAGESPLTAQFWNYQRIQNSGSTACFDGALLEVTTDGGANWVQLDSQLLTDPYNGPINSGTGNPLAGKQAWCGNPQNWLNSIAAMDEFAGETVQLRFRLGTNNSIGTEGWYLDDVAVQSCVPAAVLAPESLGSAQPGEIVTHVITLTNAGVDDSYLLSLDGFTWTTELGTASPVSVAQGESVTITIQVTIPLSPTVISDTFTLTATSVNIPGISFSVQGTSEVASVPPPSYEIYLPTVMK